MSLPPEIFKAYDIRGIVGRTLTPDIVRSIGRALGSLARERGRNAMVVGRDGASQGRSSRPRSPTEFALPAPVSSTSAW
jgi:phosphomannomutase/phosphoglucomutase